MTVEENTKLTIEGPDKQVVGQVAAEIRSFLSAGTLQGQGRALRRTRRVVRKEGKTVQ